jgi:hypothetical protein
MVDYDIFAIDKAAVLQQIITKFGKPNDTQINNPRIPKKALAIPTKSIPFLSLDSQRIVPEILQTIVPAFNSDYTAARSVNLFTA